MTFGPVRFRCSRRTDRGSSFRPAARDRDSNQHRVDGETKPRVPPHQGVLRPVAQVEETRGSRARRARLSPTTTADCGGAGARRGEHGRGTDRVQNYGRCSPGRMRPRERPPVPRRTGKVDRVAGDAIPEEVHRMIENISPQQRLPLAFGQSLSGTPRPSIRSPDRSPGISACDTFHSSIPSPCPFTGMNRWKWT